MECLSSILAPKTYFNNPFLKFQFTSLLSSPSLLPCLFSSNFVPFRIVPTYRRTRAVASEALTTNEPIIGSFVSSKKVLIPIGYGTEEMEAIIMAYVLRQAGAQVTLASVEPQLEVETFGGVKLIADTSINSCTEEKFDLIALPGGMPGSARLRDCEVLRNITSQHVEEKRLYGAICAAPAITLQPWGLLKRKRITCHPAFMDKLPTFWAVKSNIQVSGELTTSRGPGTTYEFTLSLVGQLFGESSSQEVEDFLLLNELQPRKELNEVEWLLDHPPQVLIPVANGCDEIEVVTIIDILRRAKVNVVVASIEKSPQILASRGTKIIADKLIDIASESIYDLIIVPGGLNGAKRLNKSKVLKKLLKEQISADRMYGALSSSLPLLEKQGFLKDKITTDTIDGVKVVIDGKLITSKGLSTTIDFALAIVSKLFKHTRARSVAEGLVFEYPKS